MPYDYKKRQEQAKTKKLQEKLCTKTMSPSQLNIKLITKNNKNLRLYFLKLTQFVNQMMSIIVIL